MRARAGTRYEVVLSVMAILAIAVAISASPVGAAQTFSVTTTNDTVDADLDDPACLDAAGECSLRAAVMQANKTPGADTITVPAGTYPLTIAKPAGEDADAAVGDLDVTEDLTIAGAGSGGTSVTGGANWQDRILEARSSRALQLGVSGVAFSGGNPSPTVGTSEGGALYFEALSGQLDLRDVQLTGSTARAGGGGAHVEAGSLKLTDVVFQGNTSGAQGGGLDIDEPGATVSLGRLTFENNTAVEGGGWQTDSGHSVDVENLTLVGNNATAGGGGASFHGTADVGEAQISGNTSRANGGGLWATADISIEGGTISDNIARKLGGGLSTYGGGSSADNADAITLTDVEISRNTAENGGGLFMQDYPGSEIRIERAAITDNRACYMATETNAPLGCLPPSSTEPGNASGGGASISPISSAAQLSSLDLVNVTFTRNIGHAGGANGLEIRNSAGTTRAGVRLTNVTIAGNLRSDRVLPALTLPNTGTVEMVNTLIGSNGVQNCLGSGVASIDSLGGNLEEVSAGGLCHTSGGGIGTGPGDILTADDGLDVAADGPVVPPTKGSKAIDNANDTSCPPDDQLGGTRPQDGDLDGTARCDIGAYEFVPTPPSANLSLTKSDSPDPVQVGQELTYTMVVKNDGPDPAVDASLTDTLPGTVSLVSATASPGGPCLGTTTVTCPLGTIASNGSATVTIKVKPTTDADLSNTASVTSSTADPDTGNNTAVATTVVDPAAADLSVTKSSSPDPVRIGQELTYTVTVSDGVGSPAEGATLTDKLPASLTVKSAAASQGTCLPVTPPLNQVICQLGTIAAKTSATVVIKVTPTAVGDVSNTATVAASTPDPNPLNNSATATTVVSPPSADLALTKTAPGTVAFGGAIGYTLTVRNNGPDAVASFTVTDTLPAGVTNPRNLSSGCSAAAGTVTCSGGGLAVGQSASFGVTVTAPATAGPVTNPAAITARTPADPVSGNDTASATTQVQPPGVDLSLTHSAPSLVVLGGTYVLSATVTNNGPSTATNVRLVERLRYVDDKDGLRYAGGPARCAKAGSDSRVVCTAATLAPGASVTFDLTLRPYLDCTDVGTLGDDRMTGTPGKDVLCGGAGDDTIEGRAGRDELYGMGPSGQSVRAVGSVEADQTESAPGNENANTRTTVGGPAYANDRDTIHGQDGSDLIDGGYGNDALYGDADDDTIQGGPGTDTIYGEGGGDLLEGGPGLDTIYGGVGGDRLHGGPGKRDPETGEWTPDVAPNYLDGGPGFDICSKGKPPDTRVSCERPK